MRRVFALLLLCALAAAAFGQSLRPGQRLRLVCTSEPLLNVSRTITPDGAVILPFLGSVGAAGKSLPKFQSAIEDLFRAQGRYVTVRASLAFDPSAPISFRGASDLTGSLPPLPAKTLGDILAVASPNNQADLHSISITDAFGKEFKVDATLAKDMPVFAGDDVNIPAGAVSYEAVVLGGVNKPGSVAMRDGLTVGQAIELAGGLSGHGDAKQITVEHSGVTSAATMETKLQKGDIVRVGLTLDRKFVAVKGAVLRQGVVEWHKGMLLTEAISGAGGETKEADPSRIEVRRFVGGKILKFDLVKIRKKQAADPEVGANDTIIVQFGGMG